MHALQALILLGVAYHFRNDPYVPLPCVEFLGHPGFKAYHAYIMISLSITT